MGGNYTNYGSSSSQEIRRTAADSWKQGVSASLNSFFSSYALQDLYAAYTQFSQKNASGFFSELLRHRGLIAAPKEFPDIEYESKFEITFAGTCNEDDCNEPSVGDLLSAFVFPLGPSTRFIKDPVRTVAQGKNHFYGRGVEERLVVIEKGGGHYIKTKSDPLPFDADVPFQDLVIKRKEDRRKATLEEILEKVAAVTQDGGQYFGHIIKDKGDDFILDVNDGRIYSFTVTRAEDASDSNRVQRQLEIEYAGFVPGFPHFIKDDETQIISGLVDLAKHTLFFGNNAPVAGRRLFARPTSQRKYDFISKNEVLQVRASPVSRVPILPIGDLFG